MLPGETIQSKKKLGIDEKDPHVSEFQVMRSNAGYYIGTTFTYDNCETCKKELKSDFSEDYLEPYSEPNSRETEYYKTPEQAEAVLKKYQETGILDGERY